VLLLIAMGADVWKAEISGLVMSGHVGEAVCVAREAASKGDADRVAAFMVDLGIKVSRSMARHEAALSLFEAASGLAVGEKGRQ